MITTNTNTNTTAIAEQGHLLRNIVLFARLLRQLGVQVTPTQIVDLVQGLNYIDLSQRDEVKQATRTILINRVEHLPLFEQAFDLFWQARKAGDLAALDLSGLKQTLSQPPTQKVIIGRAATDSGEDTPQTDEPLLDTVYTYSTHEVLRQKDFAHLTPTELSEVKRMMLDMTWELAHRRTRRKIRASAGAYFDLRRTFRQNLRYGGEWLHLSRRKRKEKRRPLVVICDISGSMERYSRILLKFVYVISNGLEKVEAFVFSTRLTHITNHLKKNNVDVALDHVLLHIHDWAGGTRTGDALKTFNYQWARRVLGQGAIALIISDGWDRGDIDLLRREMARLQRSCYQLIWLNPLLGSPNYEPLTQGIQAALPHVDHFLPVHNLVSLEQLGEVLVKLAR